MNNTSVPPEPVPTCTYAKIEEQKKGHWGVMFFDPRFSISDTTRCTS
jgi:hypothetical protein